MVSQEKDATDHKLTSLECDVISNAEKLEDADGKLAPSALLGWSWKCWWTWWRAGGDTAPPIVDPEEAGLCDVDATPVERVEARHGLRQLLIDGQRVWRKDGGVVPKVWGTDPAVSVLFPWIEKGLHWRPVRVLGAEDARPHVGLFWRLDDFVGIRDDLFQLLVQCWQLENENLEHMKKFGTHLGDQILEDGCRQLGINEDLIREWIDGVVFDVDRELPHYAKPPYPNIYERYELFVMAIEEVNRLLKIGKIIPLSILPWIENRTTAVVKIAPLEPTGLKWLTCVDVSASGLNDVVETWKFTLPCVTTMIKKMGVGYHIMKLDLKDMFQSWKVHPEQWTFLGFRHPLTSQTYVYCCLPFGFSLSPPISCCNTHLMAVINEGEMKL